MKLFVGFVAIFMMGFVPKVANACCCDRPTGNQGIVDICDDDKHTSTIVGCDPTTLYEFGGPTFEGRTVTFTNICDGTIGRPSFGVYTKSGRYMACRILNRCGDSWSYTINTSEMLLLRASVTSYTGTNVFEHDFDCNHPPVCDDAIVVPETLWPPNHKMVPILVEGVTDEDDDDLTITVDGVLQSEPIEADGDGNTEPDAEGVGTVEAELRAERSGNGVGRVYAVSFAASDGNGGECSNTAFVCVPHDKKDECSETVYEWYDSTGERRRKLRG